MGFAMGALPMVVGLVGTAVSAAGAISSAESTQAMDSYRAHVAEINSQIGQQNAQRSMAATEAQTEQMGLKQRALQGQQKAALGASNIALGSGSAQDVMNSTDILGKKDTQTLRAEGLQKYYGYQLGATGLQTEAGLDRTAGSNAMTSGLFNATGSALSGASSVANNYAKWQAASATSNPTGVTGVTGTMPTTAPAGFGSTGFFPS